MSRSSCSDGRDHNIRIDKTEVISGKCESMCPRDEILMRERARMVHVLEVSTSGEKQLVKSYSRSAADSVMALPHLLRPFTVLVDTVQHLLFSVTKRNDVSAPMLYDFVNDRLRAVRQDMTIQRLNNYECAVLLEPMIRFYVYFGYKLCQHPLKEYDPVLNKQYLLECLKWFLVCCDTIMSDTDDNHDLAEMAFSFQGMNIHNSFRKTAESKEMPKNINERNKIENENRTRCDRLLMESLYILCNLDNIHPISRYWTLPKELRRKGPIHLAYQIAAANERGNFIRVCRLMEKLCALTFCAVCLHLPLLQRRALRALSAAHARPVPAAALRRWLRADDAALAHYGLAVRGGAVDFRRGDFRADAPLHVPIKPLLLEEKMNLSIDHIFTYTLQ